MKFLPLIACIILIGTVSCSSSSAVEPPETQSACKEAQGEWVRIGLLGIELCNLPSSDAGDSCEDSSECKSVCVAPKESRIGESASGYCYEWTNVVGTCMKRVEDGKVQPAICLD